MSRLQATLTMDLRMQWRYRFVHAAIFITIVWLLVLWLIPQDYMSLIIPVVIFADLGVVGFYLLAGVVIYEKNESTIRALVVTPLPFREYFISKLISFTLMALCISLVIIILFAGGEVNYLTIMIGTVFTSIIALMVAFIAVARYRTISAFLMPSQFYILFMSLPMLNYFDWFQTKWFYLIPTQASFLLLEGGFRPLTLIEWSYAIGYHVLSFIVLYVIARQLYTSYLVKGR
ncbi:hypothetical protein [Bacillus solimangrovi]|uniref:Fluoroquinolone transporter permease n=1 Tax=Bacillus solimangrovi TaxID=1305675 RepID=A0A1E5LJT0_9BACI|nr:hypothetical protein [Bacillus solimangrovi]OEH94347.1 hypothetical protein BFG57_08815 [Bacillus solimangrovi]